jgi:cell division protease FtsH
LKTAIAHANELLHDLNDACFSLLKANEPVLRAIADQLLESETVPGETVYRLIREHAAAVKAIVDIDKIDEALAA